MRVMGEAFMLLNGGLDFLCLMLCARAMHLRFRPIRGALAAIAGSGYALAAWMVSNPGVRSIPALLLSGLAMTALAFGKNGWKALPGLGAAGLFLAGLCDFLLRLGWGPGGALTGCVLAAAALSLLLPGGVRGSIGFFLEIHWRGKQVRIPAFRDSGNQLRDPIRGLPVIIVPFALLRPLMPPGVNPGDLATLPGGWYFVRAKTISGEGTLMCFTPDTLTLCRGRRRYPLCAALALSSFQESRALLPEAIFLQEDTWNAKL